MSKQLDLLEPKARHRDPATSKAAAASMHRSAAVQRKRIVWLLQQHPEGLTHDAIDDLLGWPHPRAARRMKELRGAGLVRAAGEGVTGAGRHAALYAVTERAQA